MMINIYDFKRELDNKSIKYDMRDNCISFFESVQGTNVLFEILFAELKIDICETYVLGKTQPSLSFYKYLNEKNFEKVVKYTISELNDGTWVLKYSLSFFKPSFDADECLNIMLFICSILENEIEETKKAYYR